MQSNLGNPCSQVVATAVMNLLIILYYIIPCLDLQVTGKKVDDKETGSFLPEDFKNGEYEAAVRLEKQEDLKTVPEHSLTRGDLAYEKEKKLEAEVGSWVFCLDFYHPLYISCCSP